MDAQRRPYPLHQVPSGKIVSKAAMRARDATVAVAIVGDSAFAIAAQKDLYRLSDR